MFDVISWILFYRPLLVFFFFDVHTLQDYHKIMLVVKKRFIFDGIEKKKKKNKKDEDW